MACISKFKKITMSYGIKVFTTEIETCLSDTAIVSLIESKTNNIVYRIETVTYRKPKVNKQIEVKPYYSMAKIWLSLVDDKTKKRYSKQFNMYNFKADITRQKVEDFFKKLCVVNGQQSEVVNLVLRY